MVGRKSTWCVLISLASLSCKSSTDPSVILSPLDTQNFAGVFAANNVISDAAFTDPTTVSAATVQSFLEATPYGGVSFLATYASHGVTAAEAIAAAGTAERVNPLVLLVRAEADQGLISLPIYPSDPSRVEYAWRCGCSGPGVCDPVWAGLDRQLLCLASGLRASLGAIANSGATAGGWGPGQPQESLDRVTVTPGGAATAALYQFEPTVGEATKSGAWLFWNIWQRYSVAIGYYPPTGPVGPDGGP